jgi:hypothetical protein
MTSLDIVLADIKSLEIARDELPPHSHIAALFEVTLFRLREEAAAMPPPAQLKKAA